MAGFRVIIVGYGVQGRKRKAIAGADCVAVVDPVSSEADFRKVEEVPLEAEGERLRPGDRGVAHGGRLAPVPDVMRL